MRRNQRPQDVVKVITAVVVVMTAAGCGSSGHAALQCRVDSDCTSLGSYYCSGAVSYCGGMYLAPLEPGYCVPEGMPSLGQSCETDYDCKGESWFCVANKCTTISCATTETPAAVSSDTAVCPGQCASGVRKTSGGDGGLGGFRAGVCGSPAACVCDVCPAVNDAGSAVDMSVLRQ
jgi:hypothetical protein